MGKLWLWAPLIYLKFVLTETYIKFLRDQPINYFLYGEYLKFSRSYRRFIGIVKL